MIEDAICVANFMSSTHDNIECERFFLLTRTLPIRFYSFMWILFTHVHNWMSIQHFIVSSIITWQRWWWPQGSIRLPFDENRFFSDISYYMSIHCYIPITKKLHQARHVWKLHKKKSHLLLKRNFTRAIIKKNRSDCSAHSINAFNSHGFQEDTYRCNRVSALGFMLNWFCISCDRNKIVNRLWMCTKNNVMRQTSSNK